MLRVFGILTIALATGLSTQKAIGDNLKTARSVAKNNAVIVQLSTDGRLPYEEDQSGDVLAIFSDNVLGSWVRMDSVGKYSSDLVDFSFSNDFRNLTLTLKPEVKFHNGRAISSDDIQFSILRGLRLEKHAFYAGFLGCLQGVDESTHLSGASGVDGLRIINEHKVELSFKRSCYEFIHALTLPYVAPRPQEEMLTDLVHFRNLPVGAGPYQVTDEDKANGKILLKKLDGAKGPAAISLLLKKSDSEPHIVSSKAANLKGADFKTTYSKSPSATLVLFSSNAHPIFNVDPKVRSLLYKAIDRKALVENEGEDVAYSLSLLPNSTQVSHSEKMAARTELKKIFANSNNAIKIATFGSQQDLRKRSALEELTKQFSEFGIEAQFEYLNAKFLSVEDASKYAFWLASLVIDPLSPATMLSSFRQSSPFVFHRVGDKKLESLFQEYEHSYSPQSRDESGVQLDNFISHEGYGIPLVRFRTPMYFDPKKILNMGNQTQILSIDFDRITSCTESLK